MDMTRAPRVAKRLQSPEGLANEAWHLANALTAGRWADDTIHSTDKSHSITEVTGVELEEGDRDYEPVYSKLTVAFSALKRYVSTDEGAFMAPTYSITCATSQNIEKEEIPRNVLEEILKDTDDEEHPLYDAFKECGEESSDELSVESKESIIGNLDNMEILRTQSIDYSVGYDGEIEDYTIDYGYSLDENIVHEMSYIDSQSQVVWYPIRLADDSVREHRPIVLFTLDEVSLENAAKNIDSSIEQFMTNQDIIELGELSALSKQERIRRVLATISLMSNVVVDLRKPPKRRIRMVQ